jgi:hypothetical protein
VIASKSILSICDEDAQDDIGVIRAASWG